MSRLQRREQYKIKQRAYFENPQDALRSLAGLARIRAHAALGHYASPGESAGFDELWRTSPSARRVESAP